jgi:hypothetical protein
MAFFVLRNTQTDLYQVVEAANRAEVESRWLRGKPFVYGTGRIFADPTSAQGWLSNASVPDMGKRPATLDLAMGQQMLARVRAEEAADRVVENSIPDASAESDGSRTQPEDRDAERDGLTRPEKGDVFKKTEIIPADAPRPIGESVWGKAEDLLPSDADLVRSTFEEAERFVDTATHEMAKRNEDMLADGRRTSPKPPKITETTTKNAFVRTFDASGQVTSADHFTYSVKPAATRSMSVGWRDHPDYMGPVPGSQLEPLVPPEDPVFKPRQGWTRTPDKYQIREFYHDIATARSVAAVTGGRVSMVEAGVAGPESLAMVTYLNKRYNKAASVGADPVRAQYDGYTFTSRRSLDAFVQRKLADAYEAPRRPWEGGVRINMGLVAGDYHQNSLGPDGRPVARPGYISKGMRPATPEDVARFNDEAANIQARTRASQERYAGLDGNRDDYRTGVARSLVSDGLSSPDFEQGDRSAWEMQRAGDLMEDRIDAAMYGGTIDPITGFRSTEVSKSLMPSGFGDDALGRPEMLSSEVHFFTRSHEEALLMARRRSGHIAKVETAPTPYYEFTLKPYNARPDAKRLRSMLGRKAGYVNADQLYLEAMNLPSDYYSQRRISSDPHAEAGRIAKALGAGLEAFRLSDMSRFVDVAAIVNEGTDAVIGYKLTYAKDITRINHGDASLSAGPLGGGEKIQYMHIKRSDGTEESGHFAWRDGQWVKTSRPHRGAENVIDMVADHEQTAYISWNKQGELTIRAYTESEAQRISGILRERDPHIQLNAKIGKSTEAYDVRFYDKEFDYTGKTPAREPKLPEAGVDQLYPDRVPSSSPLAPTNRPQVSRQQGAPLGQLVSPSTPGLSPLNTRTAAAIPVTTTRVGAAGDRNSSWWSQPEHVFALRGLDRLSSAAPLGALVMDAEPAIARTVHPDPYVSDPRREETTQRWAVNQQNRAIAQTREREMFAREEAAHVSPLSNTELHARTLLGALPGSGFAVGHVGRAAFGYAAGAALGGLLGTSGSGLSGSDQFSAAAEGALWGAMGNNPRALMFGLRSHVGQQSRDEIEGTLGTMVVGLGVGTPVSALVEHRITRSRGGAAGQIAGFVAGAAIWSMAELGRGLITGWRGRAAAAASNTVNQTALATSTDRARDLAQESSDEFENFDIEFQDEQGNVLDVDFEDDERSVTEVVDEDGEDFAFDLEVA